MEPQNPSGPKPPNDPAKTESTSPWISPRLREKLMEAETGSPVEKEGGMPGWVPVALVVLVLAGAGGLFMSMKARGDHDKAEAIKKAEAARADSLVQAAADSARNAAQDSLRAANAAAGGEAANKPAATTAPAKPAGGTTAAAKPAGATAAPKPVGGGGAAAAAPEAAPREPGPFGIQVASFIVEDRATTEKDRLAAATKMSAQVKNVDGNYVVLLGSFKTRAAAERAAEPLLSKSLVSEAQVVPLKP